MYVISVCLCEWMWLVCVCVCECVCVRVCVCMFAVFIIAKQLKLIIGYGMSTDDHRVAWWWWKGVMDKQISYMTLIWVHEIVHPN